MMMMNVVAPALSQEESDHLEGPISVQEALSALKQTKNDNSPGSDGYTAEFIFQRLGYLFDSVN